MTHASPAADPAARKRTAPAFLALTLAKWLVMAGAVYYLWREGTVSGERLTLSGNAGLALPAAFLCHAAMVGCMSLRFHRLFRAVDAPGTLRQQLRLNFSALIAQQAGSEAGYDVFRIVGMKSLGARSADIAAVLLVDRLLGFLALIAVTLIAVAVYWTEPGTALYLAGAGVAAALPVLYAVFRWLAGRGPESWLWRIPGGRFAASASASALRFQGQGALLGLLFLVSLAAQAFVFTGLWCAGRALVGLPLVPSEAWLGGALASFTGILPLPLAGLGVGEAAFAGVVSEMRQGGGVAEFAAIFLVNRLLLLTLAVAAWVWTTVTKAKNSQQ